MQKMDVCEGATDERSCQFGKGRSTLGHGLPARLPYNFPSPPLNRFSSSCRSHPSFASTSTSTIATKPATCQRNALSEPHDASRNAFRIYEACANFYSITRQYAR